MQRWSVDGADRGALPWGGGHLLLFADLGVPSQECGAPGFPGRCGGWGADPGGVTVLGAAQLGDDGRFGGDRCRGGVCGGDGAAAARPDAGSLTEHISGGCGVFASVGNVLVRRCGGCAAAAGFPGGVVADGGERVAELLRCRVVTAPPRAGRAVTAGVFVRVFVSRFTGGDCRVVGVASAATRRAAPTLISSAAAGCAALLRPAVSAVVGAVAGTADSIAGVVAAVILIR